MPQVAARHAAVRHCRGWPSSVRDGTRVSDFLPLEHSISNTQFKTSRTLSGRQKGRAEERRRGRLIDRERPTRIFYGLLCTRYPVQPPSTRYTADVIITRSREWKAQGEWKGGGEKAIYKEIQNYLYIIYISLNLVTQKKTSQDSNK